MIKNISILIFIAESPIRSSQSALGNRPYLDSNARRVCLSGSDHRSAYPLCVKLVCIQFHDAQWCKELLEEAIVIHGTTEIIYTDQASQFSSEEFTHNILSKNIKFSTDGIGRDVDNAFIERLWRSAKYESIFQNLE